MYYNGGSMKVVSVRLDEKLLKEALKRIDEGEFNNLSELIREALRTFLSRDRYSWRDRAELRKYLRGRKFTKSGELIKSIREEDEL